MTTCDQQLTLDFSGTQNVVSTAMSDRQLIANIIGRPESNRCAEHESTFTLAESLHALTTRDPSLLQQALGLDAREADRLAAAMELHHRLLNRRQAVGSLNNPETVASLMTPRCIQDYESFWGLYLDARCQLIGEPVEISRGDIDGCDAGPRAFFRNALKRGAVSAVAVHNHPTGDPSPSSADLAVTTRLVAAGRLVDVRLVDHLVCTSHGAFVSIRRNHPETFR